MALDAQKLEELSRNFAAQKVEGQNSELLVLRAANKALQAENEALKARESGTRASLAQLEQELSASMARAAEGRQAKVETTEEAAHRLRAELGRDTHTICILGGTEFRNADSEALVKAIAPKLRAAMGSKAKFVTNGMAGVQETFAKHCGDGSRVWNLLPIGQASGYNRGTDIHAGADVEERNCLFGLIGDIYITVEGDFSVSQVAMVAHARGVAVVPLMRTGEASGGMFRFPQAALEKPWFSTEKQWSLLASKDAAVAESAAAVAAIVEEYVGACAIQEQDSQKNLSTSTAECLRINDYPYHKNLSREIFTLLDPDNVELIEESAFVLAKGVVKRHPVLGASQSIESIRRSDPAEFHGMISEDTWHTWMSKVLTVVGEEEFWAFCKRCITGVQDTIPRAKVEALKNPWFDIDFSELGKCSFRIDTVEHRAITLDQLKMLEAFLLRQTDSRGVLTGWWDRYMKIYEISVDELNLYQLADWVINPATAPYQCSFVELVSTEARQPTFWFVSHWWGEPVRNFIRCLDKHAQKRGLSDSGAYWVCAYANSQHELGKDLGKNPLKSSFARAMGMALGVLLILDDVDATPFTRIWCCFEEAVTILNLADRQVATPLLFDIATMKDGRPHFLTEGLTQDELKEEQAEPGQGWIRKSRRELNFPMSIIRNGLVVDIAKAQASVDIDRVRLLNCIACRQDEDLDKPPHKMHPRYDVVNSGLAGVFAMAAWRTAVSKGINISDDGDLPLRKALRMDRVRRELAFNFAGMEGFADGDLEALSTSLPRQLTTLRLNFDGCWGLTSLAELGRALAGLRDLTSLHLDFYECSGLTVGLTELVGSLADLKGLTSLHLDFYGCSRLTSGLPELGDAIAGLPELAEGFLSFSGCPGGVDGEDREALEDFLDDLEEGLQVDLGP